MDNKDYDLKGTLKVRTVKEEDANHLHTYCFPEKTEQEVSDELKADLAADSQTIRLVADSSGYAVGHISVKPHPLDEQIGQISDLAVSGPFRLLGVADHLVEAAEVAAVDNGMNVLEIELTPVDKPVIQRYKDWGFSEKPIVTLQKPLNTDTNDDTSDENNEDESDESPVEQASLLPSDDS